MSWANDQMLAPCRELTDEQLTTETAGTYGPLSQTLVHLARAQGGYLTTLTGWRPDAEHRLELGAPFPGVHRIADYLRFTGGRLIEMARDAAADRVLEGIWHGAPFRYPEWVILLQAPYHATEHRQQIAIALTILGIEPPEPGLVAYWESVPADPN